MTPGSSLVLSVFRDKSATKVRGPPVYYFVVLLVTLVETLHATHKRAPTSTRVKKFPANFLWTVDIRYTIGPTLGPVIHF